ncbi:MAG: YidH family protein [Cyclobacteriaceae bacterium]|jgi:putative membrane protein
MDASVSKANDGHESVAPKKKKKLQKQEFAVDRARLAQERALLAWIRTATTLMTFGFALFKFLEAQLAENHRKPLLGFITPRMIGLTLLTLGFTGLALSVYRHIRVMRVLDQYSTTRFFTPALLLAYLIMALIALLIVGSLPYN